MYATGTYIERCGILLTDLCRGLAVVFAEDVKDTKARNPTPRE